MRNIFFPYFSFAAYSAECNNMFDSDKEPEKVNIDEHSDIEENTGFAIVVNGHSLVYCLSSELEHRLAICFNCNANEITNGRPIISDFLTLPHSVKR